ncbi:hypothetical protein U9337_22635, partial [Escherichia coli]
TDRLVPTGAVAQGCLVLAFSVGGAVALLSVLANFTVFDAQARVAGRGCLLYALHVSSFHWVVDAPLTSSGYRGAGVAAVRRLEPPLPPRSLLLASGDPAHGVP